MPIPADVKDKLAAIDDLDLAVRSHCPVLITATAEEALVIARTIAVRSGCGERMRVYDFAQAREHGGTALDASEGAAVLFLREVQVLKPAEQAWLLEALESIQQRNSAPRILASSSTSLFRRVQQGAFSARLFYRLNAVHLVASHPDTGES